jgi:hypothetical protein
MDIDRDDYADGDPMKVWQDEVVRVSHRVAVCIVFLAPPPVWRGTADGEI